MKKAISTKYFDHYQSYLNRDGNDLKMWLPRLRRIVRLGLDQASGPMLIIH